MGTHLFDQMIGDLPRSTVDVAGIVRREKRRGAVRRVTALTTGAVALSVATALGLSMTGGTGASSPPSATGASAGATAPDAPFALVALTEESAAASAKKLSKALDAALRGTAPGARWIAEPGVEGRDTPDGEPPVLSYHVGKDERKAHELFNGGTGVLNQGRKGSLHLGVEPAEGLGEDGVRRHNELTCPPSGRHCEVERAPSGTKLVFQTWTSGDVRTDSYEVGLPDGRILRLLISNSFGAGGGPAPQKDTPLTRAQLKAIAIGVAGRIKA